MKKTIKNPEILEQWDFVDTNYMYEHLNDYEVIVGRYIILFSYLEHNINKLIANLLNERTDELGYLVTTKMTVSNKIDLISRFTQLGSARDVKEYKKLEKLIPKVKDLNEFRNVMAHANWASMQEDGTVRIKTKVDETNGVWFENRKLSIKDICRKCHMLENLVGDIENNYDKFF
jgi:hypothetical protein